MVRMMLHGFAMLFGHEKHALLEARCRDMRSEELRSLWLTSSSLKELTTLSAMPIDCELHTDV
jgi:1,2-phenylacetyl-CoA epoxidase PaaB subunit